MIPVTIVSGFLGAGKTTLLRRLLERGGRRFAVIVNDFGALDIDAGLIARVEPGVVSLKNGCVCCTMRGDLLEAALRVAALEPRPEHVLIETSGVSDPRAVADTFFSGPAAATLVVHSILCVVDAAGFAALDHVATELAIDQAAVSDIVVLNCCDLVGPGAVDAVEVVFRGAFPWLRMLRTSHGALPTALLDDAALDRVMAPEREAGHAHGQVFASWSWEHPGLLRLAPFQAAVAALPASVLRAKGVLRFLEAPGEEAVFQLVGKRSSLTFAPCDGLHTPNRLVAIGLRRRLHRGRPAGRAPGRRRIRTNHPRSLRMTPHPPRRPACRPRCRTGATARAGAGQADPPHRPADGPVLHLPGPDRPSGRGVRPAGHQGVAGRGRQLQRRRSGRRLPAEAGRGCRHRPAMVRPGRRGRDRRARQLRRVPCGHDGGERAGQGDPEHGGRIVGADGQVLQPEHGALDPTDSWCLGQANAATVLAAGGKSWFFITPDYTYGNTIAADTARAVIAGGGTVSGTIAYPFPGTTDFSSYLLQAQSSGAQVLAFGAAGADLVNCVKQTREFGLDKGRIMVGLGGSIVDVLSLGLPAAQGLRFSEPFYWDLNPRTRAFMERVKPSLPAGRFPGMDQAGSYAAILHYLKAVKRIGVDQARSGRAAIAAMKALPTDDDCFGMGMIREDGRKIHDLHSFQAKAVAASKGPGDVLEQTGTLSGERAFRPLAPGGCAFIKA